MSKYVIYTAIFNFQDQLHPPRNQSEDVKCIAYLDEDVVKKLKSPHNGWVLRRPAWTHKNKRVQARRHKCLPHLLFPEAEYSMWVDGCLTPKHDLLRMIEYLLDESEMATFEHSERGCVYKELEACIRLKKDQPAIMRAQLDRYRQMGYPHDNGLAETTAVLRKHTSAITFLNEAWWNEIRGGSVRDQLSLDFLCWWMKIKYAWLEGSRTKSPHFQWRAHR